MRHNSSSLLLGIGLASMLAASCARSYDIYAPGENLQALTKVTDSEFRCDFPFGGDDGKNLFFSVYDRRNDSRNIYMKENPLTGAMKELTGGRNQHFAPTYSQASNNIAFSGLQEGQVTRDILLMNATQGKAFTQVTNTLGDIESYPCLSRDGNFIVYEKTSTAGRLGDTQVWMSNLRSNENIMISNGRMPSFSPDGRTICFVKYASDGETMCLHTVNVDGTNIQQVTDAQLGDVRMPRFSPDGRRIVFQCRKHHKNDYDLYIIDRSGNGLTQLTVNKSYDGEPYWANDGNIYFASDRGGRDGNYQIWRFRIGGIANNVEPAPIPATSAATPPAGGAQGAVYHTVSSGETIAQIAARYGITTKEIVRWNNLQTMTLTPGKRLRVSEP